ncbi:MAG: copper chaperone PCu(A)C [Rhodocyclales bacterium]|nr:copper chaperone PCu(A)C [Rhodocyclales bacterium]
MSLLCAATGAAYAAGAADAVQASDATVRLMPPGARATAAFMVLKNSGDKDVKLVKAESAVAKTVELHTHLNEGGVMKMRQVPAIEIKAKSETALKPGGFHIMLIDPVPLKEGEKISFVLSFDDGSSKKIEALASRPAAMATTDHGGHEQHKAH